MKTFTTLCLLFFSIAVSFGQKTEIENKIGNIDLKQINKGALADYDFVKQTNGKITIIEFWETWCGPCIEGMGHLNALKRKFPNSLEVICVSSEKIDKTVNFITKNDFPFTFIHDEEKSLKKIFPHQGIPHTILIDKKGQIKSQTYVGFVTEQVLTELDNGNQVNLPMKKNFDSSELYNEKKSNSLMKFELLRHELGERNYLDEAILKDTPVQIVTGYSGKAYHDTLETITQYTIAGRNALEIYQYAYNNIPLTRFIYDNNLNYLNSRAPNFRYKMNFSCSNLVGDAKEILINQLNSFWGLKTNIVEKERTYYELVSINLKEDTIMHETTSTIKTKGVTDQHFTELTTSANFTAESIAALLEKQIVYLQDQDIEFYSQKDKNKRIYSPVTTNLSGKYVLNISIKDENSSLDHWIELLAKNGLSLEKKQGKVKYIQIEKVAHYTLYK